MEILNSTCPKLHCGSCPCPCSSHSVASSPSLHVHKGLQLPLAPLLLTPHLQSVQKSVIFTFKIHQNLTTCHHLQWPHLGPSQPPVLGGCSSLLSKAVILCSLTALLRCNSHTIQFIYLKCTIQWLLIYLHSELCNHYHNQFRTFSSPTPRRPHTP